jgi:tRNA G10  N-methylase Trm11
MEYVVILGRQPEFGLAELESVVGAKAIAPFGNQAALLRKSLDLNHLGGAQKLGRILYRGPAHDLNEAPLNLNELPLREGKTNFGLSYYGVRATTKFVTAAGLTLKKRLRERGSLRLVTPQEGTTLSAAQVKFNGLIGKGFELLIVVADQEMVITITTQVQDIDSYAARDYQRPARSAKVGMLPPKLAQLMVNTTSAGLIYDPFCGTGVVLQEALLLGREASGSDLNPEMVEASRENLEWLSKQISLPKLAASTAELADAREVRLPPGPVGIVSEGYLGPNLSRKPTKPEVAELQQELLELYSASLRSWREQLPKGAEVTITIPAWQTQDGIIPLGLLDRLSDLGYTLKSFAHTDTRNLIYRRPGQAVGRQLLIMRTH